jgi:hypothetical protein
MRNKQLGWNQINDFLQRELKKSKHIMTWGTIGSLNIEHDIDTIITKKPNSPSAEFFKEIHTIFENLDLYLYENFKTKVVRFAQSTQEYLVEGYTRGKKVLFHTMVYISFPQIEKDWGWALFKDEDISKILKENYTCIYGNVNDLFKQDFQRENYFENIFIYLYLYDSLNSNVPEDILLKIMNGCFKYIYKKRLKIENPIAKNKEEVKIYFYNLCEILDKLNKEKTKSAP